MKGGRNTVLGIYLGKKEVRYMQIKARSTHDAITQAMGANTMSESNLSKILSVMVRMASIMIILLVQKIQWHEGLRLKQLPPKRPGIVLS
jgi:hypothetical protein